MTEDRLGRNTGNEFLADPFLDADGVETVFVSANTSVSLPIRKVLHGDNKSAMVLRMFPWV